MKALDRLKAAASMKPQRKAVDLGNGEEFEYFATPTTLAERAKAQKQARSDDATDFAMQLLVSKAKVVASKAVASLGSQWAKSKLAGCSDTFAMFESATYLSRTRPMLLGAS